LVKANSGAGKHWAVDAPKIKYLRYLGRVSLGQRLDVCDPELMWHLVYTFGFLKRHRRDVDNLFPTTKALTDGLADAGILIDDNDSRIIGPDRRNGGLTTDTRSVGFRCISVLLTMEPAGKRKDRRS
jgi:hypothetical protein